MPEQVFQFTHGNYNLLIGAKDSEEARSMLGQYLQNTHLPQEGWVLKHILGKLAYGIFSMPA